MLEGQKIPTYKQISTKNSLDSDKYKILKKIPIIDFKVDKSIGSSYVNDFGADKIKIRQDLYDKLLNIKNIINYFDIPLTCELIVPSLRKEDNISNFGRVGLEIKLNSNSGLNKISNYENDDYYISPYSFINNKKFRIYGNARRKNVFYTGKYQPYKKIYDVYDIRQSYNITNPKIIQIHKYLLDITNIFEDNGFKQNTPNRSFFDKSIVEESFWNTWFYIPNNIKIGDKYELLLETVYDKKIIEQNKLLSDLTWDGYEYR